MIAAVCDWHEHHAAASAEIDVRLNRGESLVAAGPALVEAYAVLTRLPPPGRLSPRIAFAILDASFAGGEIVALDGGDFREFLAQATVRSIAGGQIYDAVIMDCARKGGIGTVLTFNLRHFAPLTVPGIQIVEPGTTT